MFRYNNPDALLVLLLTVAAYATVRALERANTWWLVLAMAAVGTGFITKMMQAFLVVPAIGLVYLLAAPTPLRRRLVQLAAGGGGPGGVGGMVGGDRAAHPGRRPPLHRRITEQQHPQPDLRLQRAAAVSRGTSRAAWVVAGARAPRSGVPPGGLRFFNADFGTQISWLIPAALILAVACLWLWRRRAAHRPAPGRHAAVVGVARGDGARHQPRPRASSTPTTRWRPRRPWRHGGHRGDRRCGHGVPRRRARLALAGALAAPCVGLRPARPGSAVDAMAAPGGARRRCRRCRRPGGAAPLGAPGRRRGGRRHRGRRWPHPRPTPSTPRRRRTPAPSRRPGRARPSASAAGFPGGGFPGGGLPGRGTAGTGHCRRHLRRPGRRRRAAAGASGSTGTAPGAPPAAGGQQAAGCPAGRAFPGGTGRFPGLPGGSTGRGGSRFGAPAAGEGSCPSAPRARPWSRRSRPTPAATRGWRPR